MPVYSDDQREKLERIKESLEKARDELVSMGIDGNLAEINAEEIMQPMIMDKIKKIGGWATVVELIVEVITKIKELLDDEDDKE